MKISVVGLGKLGAVMAAVFADKGNTVIGVDLNPEYVKAFNQGVSPVEETDLGAMVARNRARLSATGHSEAAVMETEATFIIVPTPSASDGTFSVTYVMAALEPIGRALARKTEFHLVVLCSTVMPGSTEEMVRQSLEDLSGKKAGVDFGLCYNPEFIALGSVIRDMLNPDMILIGESDARSGQMLVDLYSSVCENKPAFRRMSPVNAEIAKISVNTYVTTKISYANMLAEMCERLPGADIDVVTGAIGSDSRIGRKYLKGALGYGGPCFPRDNVAFAALADRLGVEATLARATQNVNQRQAPRLGKLMQAMLGEGGTAGVLGLSYKPETGVIEESQGIAVARYLLEQGIPVVVYDPAAMGAARAVLQGPVQFASSAAECAQASDVVAIVAPWKEFENLRPEHLNHKGGRPAVIDCWRILPRDEFSKVADYVMLGCGPEHGAVGRGA